MAQQCVTSSPVEIKHTLEQLLSIWQTPWVLLTVSLKLLFDLEMNLHPANIDHPQHYQTEGIECIDAIRAQMTDEEYRGFLKGNVLKYMWRERKKGGTESLMKAQWYLNKLVTDIP